MILVLLVPLLAYTRLYFWLHPRDLTFDPSLFMWLTGKPDPTCGLTRTFAYTWRGDLLQAIHVYPLGPLLFAASVVAIVAAGVSLIRGRSLSVHFDPRVRRLVYVLLGTALLLNWLSKLLWLGM
ncbi:DUF2752 domain-containing protein [Candidatus Nephthysia bennettiae]|uniref:DUF2752 domain-containing protein n=1 Tax=Candidatus Nephthysia bennettiae TaxID=3127016 RepID=A0A934JVY5_9BACT|nr:DUF2752 domain-containing protein [Candidatus Dormibacteraeota bacterium]